MAIGASRIGILTPDSYKIAFAAQWAFPCAILCFLTVLPESPWFLVRKGRYKDAEDSVDRLYRKEWIVTRGYLEVLRRCVEKEALLSSGVSRGEESGYKRCFKGSDFRRTRIACGMFFVQQFAGIALYSQSLYFLGICGLDLKLSFGLAVAGFGVALVGNVLSWVLMSYIGRY